MSPTAQSERSYPREQGFTLIELLVVIATGCNSRIDVVAGTSEGEGQRSQSPMHEQSQAMGSGYQFVCG